MIGSRVGIKIVQSSQGARISSAPWLAISSPLAKVSKPIAGRAKRKSSCVTMQV